MTNFIKSAIKYLLACAWLITCAGVWAQEQEFTPLAGEFDFLAVKDIKFYTICSLKYGEPVEWEGKGLHIGIEQFDLTLFNCREIPKFNIPDNPELICTIKDSEGNIVHRNITDLSIIFRRFTYLNKYSIRLGESTLVKRGGKYTLTAEITPGLFSYETELTLLDEPNMQLSGIDSNVDADLSPKLYLTSGYPYAPADFANEKHLHWQIAREDSPSTVITEKDEVFKLKSDTPYVAAVDSLQLTVSDLKPGRYLYTVTSSDFAPANYSFTAKVDDVLNPEISLDSDVYTVGESKEATVKIDMSYGYPYVGAWASSGEPTVTVNADLLGEQTNAEYSDAAWSDSEMHCIAEVKVPLEKVTNETVQEYEGKVPLHLSIMFNGLVKYETDLELPFVADSSGISDINDEDSSNPAIRYYNILGIEVDESYRGLVITSDGRRILR